MMCDRAPLTAGSVQRFGPTLAGLGTLQGYLAHKKTHPPLGPPEAPEHRPTVGALEGAISCKLGTPLQGYLAHKKPPPPKSPQ